ncbi:hypothetical protein O0L34_g5463 [Tuta absoluta]|nr:hypothetical protein O0L34_g5463 [Tuta absoluta]
MDSLKVNAPPSPLVTPTMGMLIKRSFDSKLLPFAMPPAAAASCEAGSTPVSPSSSASSSSSDKTDNHDTFGFFANTADMRREEDRLKTFEKWPVPFLKPETLARNGFYYLGRGDEVRCAFCKVEIMRWVEGDDPALDHQRWAPQCTFLRRQAASGNVPLESPDSTGRDECGIQLPPTATNAVRMPGPVHQKYASEAARLRSFKDWPRCMPQKPEDLAEAGFFYTGQGDKTKCFYCDGGLRDWEPEDVPWEQHARWFDRCAYVQLVKGREYVQKVISEATSPAEKSETVPPPAETAPVPQPVTEEKKEDDKETAVEEAKLCKICYVEERNVCFVPCGHVVACTKCALSTNKCPMCRRTFQNAVRLYFS